VKAAKATKLLAMKRPALYPVIDERVVRLYRVAAEQHSGVQYPTMEAIRHDVADSATVTALTTLRASLLAQGTPSADRLAQLTGLRLRDVVLWQHWEVGGEPPPAPTWPVKVAW
jgi:hypothetical protein